MKEKDKNKHSFKITIEPLDDKSGDVDLDVCIQQLSSLEKAIRKTAKKISNKNPVKLKLVQASKNSPESELPDWKDLLGIAPEATGSLLSEEFIRNLRNEWQ